MNSKKILALVLAVLMILTVLVSCNPAGGQTQETKTQETQQGEQKKYADSFSVQVGPNPETLDPALNSAVDGGNMLIMLYETLLVVDEKGEVVPGQAESYKVSEDGLTWTFVMKEGLKWSDGTPLDAKDFEYTFKRLADVNLAAPYGETTVGMIKGYADAVGNPDAEGKMTTEPDINKLNVKASEDGKELEIVLSYPCPYFDKLLSFGTMSPVQKATVETNGDKWATEPKTYVCNGPYFIKDWTPSEKIVLEKNPYYKGAWDSSKIVTNHINFLLLEDSSAAYAAYQSGEAAMIKDVPTEEIPGLKKSTEGGDFYVDTILGTYYISLNTAKEPFNNVNVRKALSYAIDREYVANTLMQGTYAPAWNFMGPGIADEKGQFYDNALNANNGETYIPKDYAKAQEMAKQFLADAGYPEGKGFPKITYSTNDAGYHKVVAEYLQKCWKDVLGIELNVEVVEWSSFTPLRRAGDYEISRNGWVMDYNDPSNQLELLYSTNGNNDGKYNNADFDKAMDDSRVADTTQHFAKLHECEKNLMDNAACIPVAYYTDFWLQSASLQGTWHSPTGYWYFMYGYVLEK